MTKNRVIIGAVAVLLILAAIFWPKKKTGFDRAAQLAEAREAKLMKQVRESAETSENQSSIQKSCQSEEN